MRIFSILCTQKNLFRAFAGFVLVLLLILLCPTLLLYLHCNIKVSSSSAFCNVTNNINVSCYGIFSPRGKCIPSNIVFWFFCINIPTWLQALTETMDHLNSLITIWILSQEAWGGVFCFILPSQRQIYGKTDVHMLYNHVTNYKIEVFWTCTQSSFYNPWDGSQEQSVLLFFFTVIFSENKSPRAPELDWSQVSYSQDSK